MVHAVKVIVTEQSNPRLVEMLARGVEKARKIAKKNGWTPRPFADPVVITKEVQQ